MGWVDGIYANRHAPAVILFILQIHVMPLLSRLPIAGTSSRQQENRSRILPAGEAGRGTSVGVSLGAVILALEGHELMDRA
jgi:hypothetical protein